MTIRGALRLTAMALFLLFCLAGWTIARLFGRGPWWVKLFLGGVGHILGLRVRIEGRPLPGPVLFVTNHISWLDILAIGGATPARFIAKAQIARWTLIGRLATIGGTVYIDRERRSETRVQADQVALALAGTRPVTLFAEGVTGDGAALLPFRPPLFVAAIEAGAMVQPVAIDYGPRRVEIAWGDTPLSFEMKRLLNRRERIPVTLRFLPPLDARQLDRKTLAARSHQAIAGALSGGLAAGGSS